MKNKKQSNRRFENFMSLYLLKPPNGSAHWLCKVLEDDRLTFEAIGILILLGEKLINSAFGIQTVLDLKPQEDPAKIIDTLCFLETLDWLEIEIHRDNYTAEDLKDYFESFYKTESTERV